MCVKLPNNLILVDRESMIGLVSSETKEGLRQIRPQILWSRTPFKIDVIDTLHFKSVELG
jgi:hypothetical protein